MRQVEMGAGQGYMLMGLFLGAYAEYSKQAAVKKGKKKSDNSPEARPVLQSSGAAG